MKKIFIFIIIVLIVIIAVGFYWQYFAAQQNIVPKPIASVNYLCNDNKTIGATFYQGKQIAVPSGQPPIPTGSVKIILSDGQHLDLKQTIAADGARYANSDESFVFWSKGNGALVLENNVAKNYLGCVMLVADPGGLPNTYHDGAVGFSIRYPADYVLDADYKYQALGPGQEIGGVKFTIPASMATGTNLSSFDTGVSVEIIPLAKSCTADLFLPHSRVFKTVTDNGAVYSFASTSEGAAGNIYEENVWSLPDTNPCVAIRYFIHSGNIDNYPSGVVTPFNHDQLINQFDQIRHSLVVSP